MMNHNSRHILLWMKKKKRRSVRNTSQENRSGRLGGCRGWKIAKIFFLSPNWIRRLCYHKATWARLSTSFKSASESAVSYLPPFSFIWYLFVPHTPPLPLSIPYEFIEKARYQCVAQEEVPSLWGSTLRLLRYGPSVPKNDDDYIVTKYQVRVSAKKERKKTECGHMKPNRREKK